ncbi:unnamed protein product [Lasius platythorax]|uniref:Uncharacterized protein n=1 Tax=Lasius platythorax TaxID=488582 RepID=A0AAV2NAI6_9HYME
MMHLSSMRGQRALNVKWMRVLEPDEEKRHSRVTIEITSRVIVVAAHNSSGNSGNGGGTYALPRAADIHEISNWQIVDFNSARGKIRARMRILDF